jgi:type II secretory pathway component GspD/PulD (secretin)
MIARSLFCAWVFAAGVIAAAPPAFGQFGRGMQPPVVPHEIKVFHLEHVAPEETLMVLQNVFAEGPSPSSPGRPSFAADHRSNSLIVRCDNDTLASIEALLKGLDVKANSTPAAMTFMAFKLKHASSNAVQSTISQSLPDFIVQADMRTNTVFVNGPRHGVASIEELVKLLDAPVPSDASSGDDVSIRLVWLVEKSLTNRDASLVPPDLVPVIEAFQKKVGFGELRTASQIIVQCTSDERNTFEASGTAQLDERFTIEFQGSLTRKESGRCALHVRASAQREGSGVASAQLRTNCASIALGQPVILGTTTIDSKASVFVVQILEK